jgi:hypothetical protein
MADHRAMTGSRPGAAGRMRARVNATQHHDGNEHETEERAHPRILWAAAIGSQGRGGSN